MKHQIKHLIWSSDVDYYRDWKDDLAAEYPDMSDNERMQFAYEINNDYLDDERTNLNIQMNKEIIIIADLGLWSGRKSAYKIISSGNIADCLSSDTDSNTWYLDEHGDFRCTAIHHDGTNLYLYRVFKQGVTETQITNLKNKIYNGTVTRRDITRVTERLGDEIANVYGWEIPRMKKVA